MLIRKQARQPQARNASSGSRLAMENAPAARQQAAGHADVRGRSVEPATLGGRVLDGQQHGAAVLTTNADALQDAECDQQDRSPDPDGVVRREQADQRRTDSHDQQRQDQHLLAADPVSEVAEDQAADRPGQESDREGPERRELRCGAVEPTEEELVEDESGGSAVEEEVVPLDRGAHSRGDRHPAGRRTLGHLGRLRTDRWLSVVCAVDMGFLPNCLLIKWNTIDDSWLASRSSVVRDTACRSAGQARCGLLPKRCERHHQEAPPAASTSSRT